MAFIQDTGEKLCGSNEAKAAKASAAAGDAIKTYIHSQNLDAGDPMNYPVIVEANKPMLKDPDLIYPGQALPIPAVSQA